MTVSLNQRAMLVTFRRSQWGGERTDRAVSDELSVQKEADKKASRVVKQLLPPEALAAVKRASGTARMTHYKYTLPWQDAGPRILRSVIYSEYAAAMRDCRTECRKAEEEFYSNYDVYIAQGMDLLGRMASIADYPLIQDVKGMFAFDLDVMPLPVGDDFRVDVPGADRIKAEIDQQTDAAAKAGMQAKLREAADMVRHMAERMEAYNPGSEGQRATGTFKDSLVENVRELAVMLPKLNLFEDPEIDNIAENIRVKLGGYDAKDLRDMSHARQAVKVDAEDILARLEGYL